MVKKKNAKKGKKQRSPIMEVPALVSTVDNVSSMPPDVDQLTTFYCGLEESDVLTELDDVGLTTTGDQSNAGIVDEAVVPDSPPPIAQHHDGSGDTLHPSRFLDKKEILTLSGYNEITVGVSVPFKDNIEIEDDRMAEKAERADPVIKKKSFATTCIKHRLEDVWVFWYYQGDKKKSWQENLLRLWEFDTVEDFWAMYNHTIQPSYLQPGRDFNLFKKGIRPEWEDLHNTGGGMWSVTLRERRMRSPEMDAVWTEVAMLLIGDQFDSLASFVNGATYSARKNQDRVSLWIRADLDRNRDEIQAIGERLRKAVQFAGNNFMLEYATSDDWKNKAGPMVNVRIVL